MPRSAKVRARNPEVPLRCDRLNWAYNRARDREGITQEELAKRVSQRLKAENARRGRSGDQKVFPDFVRGMQVNHWRTGNRRTCLTTVWRALEAELELPHGFLNGNMSCDSIPVDVELPGVSASFRFESNWSGWLGHVEPDGREVGTFAGGQEPERVIAGLWTDLNYWRTVMLEDYDEEDDAWDDPEGAAQTFLHHMLEALKIALRPIEDDAKLNTAFVWSLLGLRNPEVRALGDHPTQSAAR